jgi:hypothetical protein
MLDHLYPYDRAPLCQASVEALLCFADKYNLRSDIKERCLGKLKLLPPVERNLRLVGAYGTPAGPLSDWMDVGILGCCFPRLVA